MSDIRILQAGLPKSGNLWLYRILENILELAEIRNSSFVERYKGFVIPTGIQPREELFGHDVIEMEDDAVYARLNRFSRIRIYAPEKYVEACTHVWTHSAVGPHCGSVLTLFDKIVYIVRDPRDVAISLAHYTQTPKSRRDFNHSFDEPSPFLAHRFRTLMRDWVRNVSGYIELRTRFNIHFIFFENLVSSFDRELDGLLEYLGIDLTGNDKSLVKDRTRFEVMQTRSPHHVRRGGIYDWIGELTAAQKRSALKITQPLLQLLRYPTHAKDVESAHPEVPHACSPEQLAAARRRAEATRLDGRVKHVLRMLRP